MRAPPDELGCPRCGAVVPRPQRGALVCPACADAADGRRRRLNGDDTSWLVGDLRRAFADQVEALAYSGSCWLGRGGGSSRSVGGVPAPVILAPGTRLGDFEVLDEIGRGGMGVVYRARQISLGRHVALKVLPHYARHSRAARERFLAESRAAARIHHTNVVAIHARGEHDGQYYYAMELVDGCGLDRVLRTDPRWYGVPGGGERRLATLLAEVADGLACAHDAGVVHRDVKPHNLLVAPDGRLFLTDFGLARLADEPHLTEPGEELGTPAYRSPEQVRGGTHEIDHRADVYALGVTLYEILTGRRPFVGATRELVADAIARGAIVAPRRLARDVPVALETICLRAMEREPDRRYPTAAAFADDLRRFAAGRRTRARRPGPLRRVSRVARRHRTWSVAITAVLVITALSAGWGLSVRAGRHREAGHLLDAAYEQLAFQDYRDPDRLVGDLDRAAALGAPPERVALVRALTAVGAERHEEAETRLSSILRSAPDDRRAGYLLAWTRWRAGDEAGSREAFDAAEAVAAPLGADGWFFRGLAGHFDDPAVAVESYRQAIAVRAEMQQFHPQAALHLARAHNQRMYATRSLEPFAEAERALRELATHGVYGAYPHYLLSIAHRLAAEIYSGSAGTRGDSLAETHYRAALDWARRGQTVDPTYDRPVTAEAECLESMDEIDAALVARTRAIETATTARARWEGYHYRWRLRYWSGALEEALDDLRRCAEFDPADRFYTRVYPALVLAELGRADEAAAHARALAADTDAAEAVIWAATCLRLVGRSEEARTLLDTRAAHVVYETSPDRPGGASWLRALYDHARTGGPARELDALAEAAPAPWELWGEASFHAAARALAEHDYPSALAGFRRAFRAYDGERRYTYHGKLLWRRLRGGPLMHGNLEETE